MSDSKDTYQKLVDIFNNRPFFDIRCHIAAFIEITIKKTFKTEEQREEAYQSFIDILQDLRDKKI